MTHSGTIAIGRRIELLLLSSLVLVAPIAATAAHAMNLEFRDEAGQPLPVRVGVFTPSQSLAPVGASSHLYQSLGNKSYFYCDGFAEVNAPVGTVTIRAGCGFEYQARDTTLTYNGAPNPIVITLRRFIDMEAAGWYSGDTHVHITHQPAVYTLGAGDLLLAMKGEDLNYANSMEESQHFTGTIDPLSQADRIIHFSKEERNAHFSHLSILGLKQWISDQSCAESNIACGRTLDVAIHGMVHAQPGETAVIATHPFVTYDMSDVSPWPGGGMWRGMAIDLPVDGVDAMDLLTYSNSPPPHSIVPYFHALSAGFRLPPSAGTDCVLATAASKPLAGYRTYVLPGASFTMDSWIAGFKAGRSFVSNYPLFTHFDVEGGEPGEVLYTSDTTLNGSVSVMCGLPVTKIEIIGDSGVLFVFQPPTPRKSMATTFSIPRAGLTWIVARATGPASTWHLIDAAGLFAQTAPVYIEDSELARHGGDPVPATGEARISAAMYFLARVDELETLYEDGNFPANSRPAFDAAITNARAHYLGLLNTTGVTTPSLRTPWELKAIWPNPSERETHVTYRVPPEGGMHSVDVYDAAGRRVRRLYAGARAAGDYRLEWDGRDARGSRVVSGVYLVRIRPQGAAPVARKLVLIR